METLSNKKYNKRTCQDTLEEGGIGSGHTDLFHEEQEQDLKALRMRNIGIIMHTNYNESSNFLAYHHLYYQT